MVLKLNQRLYKIKFKMRIGLCPNCKNEMFKNIRFNSYYVLICPNCKKEFNINKKFIKNLK